MTSTIFSQPIVFLEGDRYRRDPYAPLVIGDPRSYSPSECVVLEYDSLPKWTAKRGNMKSHMAQLNRCVRVGGVLDHILPDDLASLIQKLFEVEVIGASKVGPGLFVIALDNFEDDKERLVNNSEWLWMGPFKAVLSLTAPHREAVLHDLNLVKTMQVRSTFPRHLVTFGSWLNRQPARQARAVM